MNKNKFNPIEIDFIEFLARRQNTSFEEPQRLYKQARKKYSYFRGKFHDKTARAFSEIYRLIHNPRTEEELFDAYRSMAGFFLLRQLSYSHPKSLLERWYNVRDLLKRKQYKEIFHFGVRFLKTPVIKKSTVDMLLENTSGTPVIVDYGCGTAQISSKIAEKIPSAKVYLLDVDTLVLEFTVFRFTKYKYNFEVIKVSKDNLYPTLPEHNICLANEVMEHVFEPLRVYENIHQSMAMGGLLYGNFADHSPGMLHISPDLSALRNKINLHYKSVDSKIYRKIC